jgi:hypothetical protein
MGDIALPSGRLRRHAVLRHHREDKYGQMTTERLDADEWESFEIDLPTDQREVDVKPVDRRG